MKKFTLLFFLIILSYKTAQSQTIKSDSASVHLSLYSDYNTDLIVRQPLKITNTQTATISGVFSSDGAVKIIPTSGYSIIIKPLNFSSSSTSVGGRNHAEGTTVIRSSSSDKKGGRIDTDIVNIYPNPVDNVLNFDSSTEPVISYQIRDIYGNLKMSQNITPTAIGDIDVSSLTPGYYFLILSFQNNNAIANIKFKKN
jgi:hypothetical protein